MSADGTVVVGIELAPPNPLRAWRWTAATGIVFLTDPNERSVANAVTNNGAIAFGSLNSLPVSWTGTSPGVLLDLPDLGGGELGEVMAASEDGTLLAGEVQSLLDVEAFGWTDGIPVRIFAPKLITDRPSARAVSGGGTVAGGANVVPNGDSRAFIWDARYGTRDLTTLAISHDASLGTFVLESADGVSGDGLTFAGVGSDSGGPATAWLLTLPVTAFVVHVSTFPLWGFALLGLMLGLSLLHLERRRE